MKTCGAVGGVVGCDVVGSVPAISPPSVTPANVPGAVAVSQERLLDMYAVCSSIPPFREPTAVLARMLFVLVAAVHVELLSEEGTCRVVVRKGKEISLLA